MTHLLLFKSHSHRVTNRAVVFGRFSNLQVRSNKTFIQQVMDQVQRDAESDPQLRQAMKKNDEAMRSLKDKVTSHEDTLKDMKIKLSTLKSRAGDILDGIRGRVNISGPSIRGGRLLEFCSRLNPRAKKIIEDNKTVGKAGLSAFLNFTNKIVNSFNKEDTGAAEKRAETFRKQQDNLRSTKETVNHNNTERYAGTTDVVIVDDQKSWNWFGFSGEGSSLGSFFENPFIDRIFGESELAAAIRHMKEIDREFKVWKLNEDVEHVVAPSILKWFLNGDAECLRLHLGEGAFAAANNSIKARAAKNLSIEGKVLCGPSEVELKGAKAIGIVDSPTFIYTFVTQQVNCLKDGNGNIIEGDIDDIRQIHYAIAIQSHPEPETDGLEFQWKIQEIAIIGNSATL